MFISFRLLLWDCDDRSYSYYVEVSNNKTDWELVWDRSKQPCKSWQHITFPRRPLVMIRIVGTHNTANEVFHCVHFESPAVTNVPKSSHHSDSEALIEDQNDETDEEADIEAGIEANEVKSYDVLNDGKDDAFSHVSIHSSPSSNAGSVS